MNYLKVYCNLIRRAENRTPPEGYTEKHHTFPVSIFGKNKRIVVLTAREHYIAHALLEKIYIKRYGLRDVRVIKMTFAHCMMKSNDRYFNSYLYENARIRLSNLSKGRTLTEETKKKLSEINTGNKNGFYGKSHTYEIRKMMSELKKGNKNALGYKMTKEQIEKSRQKRIGKKLSEEHKQKLSQHISGRKWWNNGAETKMSFDCPGDGWVLGRAKEIKGRRWWNDGRTTKMSVECPGTGWIVGRLKLNTNKIINN